MPDYVIPEHLYDRVIAALDMDTHSHLVMRLQEEVRVQPTGAELMARFNKPHRAALNLSLGVSHHAPAKSRD